MSCLKSVARSIYFSNVCVQFEIILSHLRCLLLQKHPRFSVCFIGFLHRTKNLKCTDIYGVLWKNCVTMIITKLYFSYASGIRITLVQYGRISTQHFSSASLRAFRQKALHRAGWKSSPVLKAKNGAHLVFVVFSVCRRICH